MGVGGLGSEDYYFISVNPFYVAVAFVLLEKRKEKGSAD
jgi:hypothetical protein